MLRVSATGPEDSVTMNHPVRRRKRPRYGEDSPALVQSRIECQLVSLSRFSAARLRRLRFYLRYYIYTKISSITDHLIQQIKNKQRACLPRSCFEGTPTTHINADTTYQYSECLFPNNFSAGGTVIVQIAGQEMERTIKASWSCVLLGENSPTYMH